jgi:DNA end-binding protein Ku
MPRSFWTGAVSFGLVEIPVSLYSAENPEEDLKFNLLDKRTMKPVGYERVNKETGEKVAWGDIVRGYEHEKGEYVVLSDAELGKADVEKSRTIDIVGFVELDRIDPVHYVKPYYLSPTKKDSKGYALLHKTLEKSGKAGIAKIVMRTRQHLAALTTRGAAMTLIMLRYADEIRSPSSLDISEADLKALKISDKELELAERLVDEMTMEWKPAQYHDDYREDVLSLIERKVKAGKVEEIDTPHAKPRRRGEVHDLMPLLKASLDAGGKPARAAPPRSTRRRVRKGA